MKAKKGQEKVESMAIKLFRFNYARDLMNTKFNDQKAILTVQKDLL
jgi:hypothetical protein